MPLGGGGFTLYNKILPGAYINFYSSKTAAMAAGRGVVSLPLVLKWGKDKEIIKMDAADFYRDAFGVFGYDASSEELLLVREALKRAKTILAYKVNQNGTAATGTIGGLTCTAKCTGSRGNDLKVAVVENPDGGFDVVTYMEYREIERQTVTTAAEVKENDFVVFKGTQLTAAAGTALTGGADGTADGAAYTKYLAAIEAEDFNTLGYPGDDEDTKALFAAFTKRLADDEGYKITCVLADYAGDHEQIINVENGVKLANGRLLTPAQAVAWAAGATAGAEMNESLTDKTYEDAVDVFPKYTRGQYEENIRTGKFCFYAQGGKVKVLADINSLTTFANGKTQDWTSNRVIRVLNGWGNDVARIFGSSYLGSETNNATGRDLFKGDLVSLGKEYERVQAISDFSKHDIEVTQGAGKRDVNAAVQIKPNDSMEKLYMVCHVQ